MSSLQAREATWQPHSAGCDSSDCSLCHWQHQALSRPQQQAQLLKRPSATDKVAAEAQAAASAASLHSSQISATSCQRLSMTRLDGDACSAERFDAAAARQVKRQRIASCGGSPQAALQAMTSCKHAANDTPSSQSGGTAGDDALVPSDTSRLARAAGSYTQLTSLDCWVPTQQALKGRCSSVSTPQHTDNSDDCSEGVDCRNGDDHEPITAAVSAHVLPQIVAPGQQQPTPQQPDATVPAQQQRKPLSDRQFVASLEDAAVFLDEGSRSAPSEQLATLTEVSVDKLTNLWPVMSVP